MSESCTPSGGKEPAGKYHETWLEHQSTATAPLLNESYPKTVQVQEGRAPDERIRL